MDSAGVVVEGVHAVKGCALKVAEDLDKLAVALDAASDVRYVADQAYAGLLLEVMVMMERFQLK